MTEPPTPRREETPAISQAERAAIRAAYGADADVAKILAEQRAAMSAFSPRSPLPAPVTAEDAAIKQAIEASIKDQEEHDLQKVLKYSAKLNEAEHALRTSIKMALPPLGEDATSDERAEHKDYADQIFSNALSAIREGTESAATAASRNRTSQRRSSSSGENLPTATDQLTLTKELTEELSQLHGNNAFRAAASNSRRHQQQTMQRTASPTVQQNIPRVPSPLFRPATLQRNVPDTLPFRNEDEGLRYALEESLSADPKYQRMNPTEKRHAVEQALGDLRRADEDEQQLKEAMARSLSAAHSAPLGSVGRRIDEAPAPRLTEVIDHYQNDRAHDELYDDHEPIPRIPNRAPIYR